MLVGAIQGLVISIPLSWIAGAQLHYAGGPAAALPAIVIIVAGLTAAGAQLGRVRWARTRWRLTDLGLDVRRGVWWQVEVFVPRARVQHLDLERGPLERRFDLATLIVHTAGSQNHAVRQSGLTHADAVGLRAALVPEVQQRGDAL